MTKRVTRLALSGSIGSGKSAVANLFVERLGYTKISFADKIRQEISSTHSIPIELLHGETKEEYRNLLIEYGERKRKENRNYWIKPVLQQIRRFPTIPWVVDDLRFSHEAKRLHEHDFVCIKLECSSDRTYEYLTKLRGLPHSLAVQRMQHTTETNLWVKDIDYIVPVGSSDFETYRSVLSILVDIEKSTRLGGKHGE